jgi:hypothetical protein
LANRASKDLLPRTAPEERKKNSVGAIDGQKNPVGACRPTLVDRRETETAWRGQLLLGGRPWLGTTF